MEEEEEGAEEEEEPEAIKPPRTPRASAVAGFSTSVAKTTKASLHPKGPCARCGGAPADFAQFVGQLIGPPMPPSIKRSHARSTNGRMRRTSTICSMACGALGCSLVKRRARMRT